MRYTGYYLFVWTIFVLSIVFYAFENFRKKNIDKNSEESLLELSFTWVLRLIKYSCIYACILAIEILFRNILLLSSINCRVLQWAKLLQNLQCSMVAWPWFRHIMAPSRLFRLAAVTAFIMWHVWQAFPLVDWL